MAEVLENQRRSRIVDASLVICKQKKKELRKDKYRLKFTWARKAYVAYPVGV